MARHILATHHLVTLSAWASKVVIAASQLVGLKLLIDVLGAERYGIYVVIASFAGWIQLMDFGVGNALQNAISAERERGRAAQQLIAGLALLLPGLVLVFGGGMLVLVTAAGSSSAAFLDIATRAGVDVLVVACLLFFAAALGGIAYKIWYAEQRGWWANLFPALAALAGLGLMLVARELHYGDFLGVLLLYHLPPAVLALSVLLWRLWGVRADIPAATRSLDWKPFLRRAFGFFAFALASALVLQLDYFIMAARASVYEMVSYNIVSRLFAMVGILHTAYLNSLWPVCSQLLVAGRGGEVTAIIRRAVFVGMALVAGFYVLFFVGRDEVAHLLIRDDVVQLSGITISLMAGYFLIRAWCDSWAIVFLSAGDLAPLWMMVPAQAVISIGLQLLLVRTHGVDGIIVALSLSFLLTVAWMLPLLARKRILLRG